MAPAAPSKFSVTTTPPADKLIQATPAAAPVTEKVEDDNKGTTPVATTTPAATATTHAAKTNEPAPAEPAKVDDAPKPKRGLEKFTKKESSPAASTEPNYKEMYEQLERKHKTLSDEIETDVFLNRAFKAKQEGKNLLDEIKPLVTDDPSNFTDEDLLRRDLKRKGKDAAYIEKEIEKFNAIESDYQKERIVEPLKAFEQNSYNDKSKLYTMVDYTKSKEPSEQEVSYKKALISEVESNDNKEFYGITQTADITKKALNAIQNGRESRAYDEKGNLDVEGTMRATFAADKKNWDLLIQTVYNEGVESGKTQLLEDENANRPLHSGTGTGNQQVLTPMQKLQSGKSKISVVEAQ